MPRCARAGRGGAPPAPGAPGPPGAPGDTDAPLARFYARLPPADRAALLSVDKRAIFERIRANYCSRCFGLFVLRYEELRNSDALKCPACAEFYAGLVVQDEKESERGKERLSLEKSILAGQPFTTFAESKARERERELQFMAGDICGSGWVKRKGGESMCALHTAPVPLEALLEFWEGLPPEHCTALFRLRDEDFAAEVDAQLRYTLKICRDCRSNVMREYRQLKAGKGAAGGSPNEMEVCKDHFLCISDGLVTLGGKGAAHFFERAEEVEECKVVDGELGGGGYGDEVVRHAETPELAREALADSAALIFKGQVEVAFREQTAGHNALLLFVHLALGMMEEKLLNAFKELRAKQAEAELLELVAKDEKQKESKRLKRRAKKPGRVSDESAELAAPSPVSRSPSPAPGCRKCEGMHSDDNDGSRTPRTRPPSPVHECSHGRHPPPHSRALPVPKSPEPQYSGACLHSKVEPIKANNMGDASDKPGLGTQTTVAAAAAAHEGDWETIQGGKRRSSTGSAPRRASSLGTSGSTGSSPLATRSNSPDNTAPSRTPAQVATPLGSSPPQSAHRLAAARSAAGLNPWLVAAPPPPPPPQPRSTALPLHLHSGPPPPPPPRRTPVLGQALASTALSTPSHAPAGHTNAWVKPTSVQGLVPCTPTAKHNPWATSGTALPHRSAAAQSWSPWGPLDMPVAGREANAWHKVAIESGADLHAGIGSVFSLFAHSPLPADVPSSTSVPSDTGAYHLFGSPAHPAYPLQTLLPSVQ